MTANRSSRRLLSAQQDWAGNDRSGDLKESPVP
jgi:hypothetical protein